LQAFDFDDLVCEPVRLWRKREDALVRWRQRFRYLIVDEYQDTNQAQLEMLRMLAAEHRNLCVVGDDDQAIYAWRGADVRNILDFERHFSPAKVVRLERNYRSSEAVLDVANAVLDAASAKRHKKRLIATRGPGDRVKLIVAKDGTSEARFVAEEAHRLIDYGSAKPSDIAVLYRSNLQAGEIEAELRARGVPYQVFGGTQTFERKEVKDLLAYLTVCLDPFNELAVRRSLNYPARGVGDAALAKIGAFATANDVSLYSAVARAYAISGLSPAAREGARDYLRIVSELDRALNAGTAPHVALRQLTETLDLKRQLWAECGQNNKAAARRWANVEFLLRAFERRHDKEPLDRERLLQFLRMLLLREQDADEGERGNKMTLVTMHGAKGLEFRYVFVVGLEEGLMPHARTLDERATDTPSMTGAAIDEIEQERRLLYVAITRAKEQLYLCHAQTRPARGKMVKRAASRFLLQVPEALLERRDLEDLPDATAGQVAKGAKDVLAAILGGS
jgi:DNA helicase-2/ATP-dependent DNA helicase PcrA